MNHQNVEAREVLILKKFVCDKCTYATRKPVQFDSLRALKSHERRSKTHLAEQSEESTQEEHLTIDIKLNEIKVLKLLVQNLRKDAKRKREKMVRLKTITKNNQLEQASKLLVADVLM